MIQETSCGAVIFFLEDSIPRYLLLKYTNYWGFVKGNIEKGENEESTLKREAREEANISKLEIIHGFRHEIEYFYKLKGKIIKKNVIFLLGRINEEDSRKVKISFEHEAFIFKDYEEAQKMLKHKNEKLILEKVNEFLQEYHKN
ncbi:NUDIX domain-containing protein [Candidatus Pacearchaeota archaeon]|nr:NUDIX domain-containing protein [Candidatus Pacearchaeota archaeon]